MEKSRISKKLSIIIILSVLGATVSVPVGYAGRLLATIPLLSLVSSQLLSGSHIFWLILAAMLVNKKPSGTVTGALKGLIEAFLFSHLGVFVFLISFVEGLVVDVALTIFKRTKVLSAYLAGGFSSASNVAVLQFILIPNLPTLVYVSMYLVSFLSGMLFGGYIGNQILKVLPPRFRSIN